MDFGNQIKAIRTENGLTQEQFSQRLHVSRQAVSNWENNRNLPDIEALIAIATTFKVSLDTLILGDNNMNEMAEKLIKDGSEGKRARFLLVGICIGAALLLIGGACLFMKALSPEYVDSTGMLHESFFLLPIGFLFLFAGFASFFAIGIGAFASLFGERNEDKAKCRTILIVCLLVTFAGILFAFGLYLANSGAIQ